MVETVGEEEKSHMEFVNACSRENDNMVVDGFAKEAGILPPVALKGKRIFIKFMKHSLIFLTLFKVKRTEFNK